MINEAKQIWITGENDVNTWMCFRKEFEYYQREMALDGTKNHAWSGGPLITMAKYIAGIRPEAVGYEKLSVKPHLGHLQYIKCCVSSARGEIIVDVEQDKNLC